MIQDDQGKKKIVDVLQRLINEGNKILYHSRYSSNNYVSSHEFTGWTTESLQILLEYFGNQDFFTRSFLANVIVSAGNLPRREHVRVGIDLLERIKNQIDEGIRAIKITDLPQGKIDELILNPILFAVFNKFHLAAKRLQSRRKDKKPFLIEDEYDVQDLLKVLLTPFFKEIRPEEPQASVAGSYTKMDFVLNGIRTAIETKFVHARNQEKKISDEIFSDIAHCKKNGECKRIIFFIYDPETQLLTSTFKKDIEEQSTSELQIMVLIEPKR
jgi:hypothetical protein